MKHSKTSVLTSGHVFKSFTLTYRVELACPCPEDRFSFLIFLSSFRSRSISLSYTLLVSCSSRVLEYKVYVLIVSNSISASQLKLRLCFFSS